MIASDLSLKCTERCTVTGTTRNVSVQGVHISYFVSSFSWPATCCCYFTLTFFYLLLLLHLISNFSLVRWSDLIFEVGGIWSGSDLIIYRGQITIPAFTWLPYYLSQGTKLMDELMRSEFLRLRYCTTVLCTSCLIAWITSNLPLFLPLDNNKLQWISIQRDGITSYTGWICETQTTMLCWARVSFQTSALSQQQQYFCIRLFALEHQVLVEL
jgi:hypothetical protein